MKHAAAALGAAALVVAAAGCADPRPRTQVMVVFEADRLVQRVAREIELEVFSGERGDEVPALRVQSLPLSLDAIGGFPVSHALVPENEEEPGLFRIEGRLFDGQSEEPIATVRAISGYVRGRTLILRLRFYAECLYVDACTSPEQSCGPQGNCESAREVPGDLPSLDGGVGDAGTDPFCASDLDCDDGVGCTNDACVSGACLNAPDDALCTAMSGGTCHPTAGCQYGTCDATTCIAGPCESAACDTGLCVRMSECRLGEECCGGACVPPACNDGDTCTVDLCDEEAGACVRTDGGGACDDGVFCNGEDSCVAGACTGHEGSPCEGGLLCDEAGETCECRSDADCPDGSTSMSMCVATGPCGGAGTWDVTMDTWTCEEGTCVSRRNMSPGSCTAPAAPNRTACGTGPAGPFGTCTPTSGTCGTTGQRTATAPLLWCIAGACVTSGMTTAITEGCAYTPPPLCMDGGVPIFDSGFDSGPRDAGSDAGPRDAGSDAGPRDAGSDAGPRDAGSDAGPRDGGTGPRDGGSCTSWPSFMCTPSLSMCMATCGSTTITCNGTTCQCNRGAMVGSVQPQVGAACLGCENALPSCPP